jgi:nitroreductase
MHLTDIIRRRRMIRSFTDAPVAPESIDRIIDIARRAPSAGFSQGVEFIVITDDAIRTAITRAGADARAKSGLPAEVSPATVLIVICTSAEIYKSRYRERDKAPVRDRLSEDQLWSVPYWHTDAGAALMLILLAAVDEGLGASFVGAVDQDALKQLLAIPDEYTAVGIVFVGHAAPDADRYRGSAATRPRRPLSDILHRNRW